MKQIVHYEWEPQKEANFDWEGSPQMRFYKIVKMFPEFWNKGSMITFKIIAKGSERGKAVEIVLKTLCLHDHRCPKYAVEMGLLSGGDVRGHYANQIAYRLFYELFMPTEEYKTEFPDG